MDRQSQERSMDENKLSSRWESHPNPPSKQEKIRNFSRLSLISRKTNPVPIVPPATKKTRYDYIQKFYFAFCSVIVVNHFPTTTTDQQQKTPPFPSFSFLFICVANHNIRLRRASGWTRDRSVDKNYYCIGISHRGDISQSVFMDIYGFYWNSFE